MQSLPEEFVVLCRQLGEVQQRCSAAMAAQAAQIKGLQAQVVRLRAEIIVRETRLAWLNKARVEERAGRPQLDVVAGQEGHQVPGDALEASLAAADWVICQTGCLSHDAYWRVQDHCRRTGKTCLLVNLPEAARPTEVAPQVPVPLQGPRSPSPRTPVAAAAPVLIKNGR